MKQVTQSSFAVEVLAAKEPVVVDFYSDDCNPCRSLSPILQEWESESHNAFKVVKVDAAAEAALASTHSVRAVPTLLLFSGGQCVGQSVGLKSKANLKRWLDDSLKAVV